MIQLPPFLRKFFTENNITPPQEKKNDIQKGDHVVVCNHVSLICTDGNKPSEQFKRSKVVFIVEETGKKIKLTLTRKGEASSVYTQDLILKEPHTGKSFRVSSKHVRRTDWVRCRNGK